MGWFMPLMANLPRIFSEGLNAHGLRRGMLDHSGVTGLFGTWALVLLSFLGTISAKWAVWQSYIGQLPFWICPGWLMMMTWAILSWSLEVLESPGTASVRDSQCILSDLTSVNKPEAPNPALKHTWRSPYPSFWLRPQTTWSSIPLGL